MFLIFLVYIAALTLETLGSYIAIVGLASKTGPILIAIAITLDFSKIILASVLYKQWFNLSWILKIIFIPVTLVLIGLTSSGAYSYIVKEFNSITNVSEQQQLVLSIQEEEKAKLEERKNNINEQVAQLPSNYVRQRANLMKIYEPELTEINTKLEKLDAEILTAKTARYDNGNDSTNSTIASLSKVWDVPPEQINKIIALFFTVLIDPLAIALLILAHFLSAQRRKDFEAIKVKDYVAKTKKEKLKELIFGKDVPFVAPEVNVFFKDLDKVEIQKENIVIHNFIKTCELKEKGRVFQGETLFAGNFLNEVAPTVILLEELKTINFINSCELKKDENRLFDDVRIPESNIEAFQFLFEEVKNDKPASIEKVKENQNISLEEFINTPEDIKNNDTSVFNNEKEIEQVELTIKPFIESESIDFNDEIGFDLKEGLLSFTPTTIEIKNDNQNISLNDEEKIFSQLTQLQEPPKNPSFHYEREKFLDVENDNFPIPEDDRLNTPVSLWIDEPETRAKFDKDFQSFYKN